MSAARPSRESGAGVILAEEPAQRVDGGGAVLMQEVAMAPHAMSRNDRRVVMRQNCTTGVARREDRIAT